MPGLATKIFFETATSAPSIWTIISVDSNVSGPVPLIPAPSSVNFKSSTISASLLIVCNSSAFYKIILGVILSTYV